MEEYSRVQAETQKKFDDAKQERWVVRSPETDSFYEKTLSSNEPTSNKELGGGVNETRFINLKDDGSAVFKPKKGENVKRSGFESGTLYKRERAAYLVDKFINLGLVPPTVIRNVGGEVGSAQQFIPDAETASSAWRPERRPSSEDVEAESKRTQLASLALFDYLIFNSDRHFNNALVKKGRLYAIDHGLAFGDSRLRNQSLLEWGDPRWLCGEPIPEEIRIKIRNFLKWEEGKRILHDLLSELLSEKEVDAFSKRLTKVAELIGKGNFPSKDTVAFELTFDGGAPREHGR